VGEVDGGVVRINTSGPAAITVSSIRSTVSFPLTEAPSRWILRWSPAPLCRQRRGRGSWG
jgi:hypothetical protein